MRCSVGRISSVMPHASNRLATMVVVHDELNQSTWLLPVFGQPPVGELVAIIPGGVRVKPWVRHIRGGANAHTLHSADHSSCPFTNHVVSEDGVVSSTFVVFGNCGEDEYSQTVILTENCGKGVFCGVGFAEGDDLTTFYCEVEDV